jgi:hypothetical protein
MPNPLWSLLKLGIFLNGKLVLAFYKKKHGIKFDLATCLLSLRAKENCYL